MNLEDNNEQPPATSKPASDFNDLHVIAGLDEVRRQIETAIASSDFALAVSPHPLNLADQNLGQMSENETKIGNSDDDFQLDYAPPMNTPNKDGEPEPKGKGEIIEFERPEFSLDKCLARFMLVEGKTEIWDDYKKKTIKSLSLIHI